MHESERERIARTESLFREVNERIAESAERFESTQTEFVCECGDPACTNRVEATLETYEAVRQDSTTFLLSPGHRDERIERVVGARPGYEIVQKFGRTVAAVVRRLDPRTSAA